MAVLLEMMIVVRLMVLLVVMVTMGGDGTEEKKKKLCFGKEDRGAFSSSNQEKPHGNFVYDRNLLWKIPVIQGSNFEERGDPTADLS